MDLRILEIASNTENNKILNKHTHKSKNKNPMCGDEMEISLIVKDDKIIVYKNIRFYGLSYKIDISVKLYNHCQDIRWKGGKSWDEVNVDAF